MWGGRPRDPLVALPALIVNSYRGRHASGGTTALERDLGVA